MKTWHCLSWALIPLALAGCTSMPTAGMYYPTTTNGVQGSVPRYDYPPIKNAIGGGGSGSVSVTSLVTHALYQSDLGPLVWRGDEIDMLANGTTTLVKVADAPPESCNQAIAAVNANSVWAVGSGIMRLVFGQWATASTDIDASFTAATGRVRLTDIGFAAGAETVGYAVGTRGTVLRYDGIRTWFKQTLPSGTATANFGSVKVFGPSDVWVAGDVVLHLGSSGWVKTDLPSGVGPVSGLAAVGPNNLWAATSQGLLQWNGMTWMLRYVPAASRLASAPVIVASGSTVIGVSLEAGVPDGKVFQLNADGNSWSAAPLSLPAGLTADSLAVDGHGLVLAHGMDDSGLWAYDLGQATWTAISN